MCAAQQKPHGLTDRPIAVGHALPAGAFPAKAANPGIRALVDQFHAVFGLDSIRIVAAGRVPDREDHDFATFGQLLDTEVPGIPAASHEVAAGDRFLNRHFQMEPVGIGCGPSQVHRGAARGAASWATPVDVAANRMVNSNNARCASMMKSPWMRDTTAPSYCRALHRRGYPSRNPDGDGNDRDPRQACHARKVPKKDVTVTPR